MSVRQNQASHQPQHPQMQHSYQGSCWWCASPADSREHRYKKTDVVRAFGPGPWTDGVVRVRSDSDYEEHIQGPNSDKLKFAKVLCANCNNAKSQPFDVAYDTFASFVHLNSEAVVKSGTFQFSKIYGTGWRDARRDLGRYFIKNICCRLAEDGVRVPSVVIDYMNGTLKELPNFILEMNINMAKYEFGKHEEEVHGISDGSLWTGNHGIIYDAQNDATGTYSHLGFEWFNLDYQFHFSARRGRANFFAGDTVRLERFWPSGVSAGDVARTCGECNPGGSSI